MNFEATKDVIFEVRLETFYNTDRYEFGNGPKYEIIETHRCTEEEIKKFYEPSEA